MTGSILYMGDTSLDNAAAYLTGLMSLWGMDFDYVPSHEDLHESALDQTRSLFILSDYPSLRIPTGLQHQIIDRVNSGAGLLMIGGWESFHGLGGDWDGTPIATILPVLIHTDDDRLNCDHPVFVRPTRTHATTDDLPWNDRPPLIGGLNRVQAKPEATTVLRAEHYQAEYHDQNPQLTKDASDPLLVVGHHGDGRTAAFMTDVAPHWVGPLVDWGPQRVSAAADGTEGVEVGNLYARFLHQILSWTAGAA